MPPIIKGTNASKVLASQPHHPLQSACSAVGIVYELPKKGVFPKHPRVRRIAPSPKKPLKDGGSDANTTSPQRQNDEVGQQHKKKEGSLVPPVFAHSPIRRSAHLKGGWGTRLKVVETWFYRLMGL